MTSSSASQVNPSRRTAVAVAEILERVKETLRGSCVDWNVIVGALTLERASTVPDTTTGTLRKGESFILQSAVQLHLHRSPFDRSLYLGLAFKVHIPRFHYASLDFDREADQRVKKVESPA